MQGDRVQDGLPRALEAVAELDRCLDADRRSDRLVTARWEDDPISCLHHGAVAYGGQPAIGFTAAEADMVADKSCAGGVVDGMDPVDGAAHRELRDFVHVQRGREQGERLPVVRHRQGEALDPVIRFR
jgi:hypothetical protein